MYLGEALKAQSQLRLGLWRRRLHRQQAARAPGQSIDRQALPAEFRARFSHPQTPINQPII